MNSHEPSPPSTAPSACPGCESLRQRLDEAIAERDQTIAGLQVAINEMHIRAVDAEAGFPCVNERDTTITSLRDSLVAANAHAAKLEREAHKDRASIVAFLAAEAKRLRGDGQSPAAWKGGPDATVRLEDERIVIAFPSPDGKWQHAYSHTAEEAATLHTRLSAALRQRTDALGVDDAAPAKPSADELLRSIIDELLRKIDRMPCTAHDFLGTALYTKAAQAVGAPWVEEVDQ